MYALVLSCNDVIADCVIVDVDDEGVRPLAYTQVGLPPWVRPARETSPMGTPAIKRGDYLRLDIEVVPENWNSEKEEGINEIMDIFKEIYQDEEELITKLDEHNKKFDKEWKEIVRSDYAKRMKKK